MDKVSIIIPVYNVEPYLPRMFDSLLGQTYPEIEVLAVDDRSPDGSREIIRAYAEKDARVRPIYFEQNRGVSAARNAALDAATGDWICFCDGDDWYAPTYVEDMLACAKREDADMVIADYYLAADGTAPFCPRSTAGWESGCNPRALIACGTLYSWNRLIHRSLFEKTGARYPLGISRSEELPVIPLLTAHAKRIGVVDKPLYYYYQRTDGSSVSNTLPDNYEETFFTPFSMLCERLGDGYEKELEMLVVSALFYGRILNLCKERASAAVIKQKLAAYKAEYPDYAKNPYLPSLGIFKRLFIRMEKRPFITGLRLLAFVHRLLVH